VVAVGAILVTLVYRHFSGKLVREASIDCMRLTVMVMWFIIGASTFSAFHMLMGAGKML
jgi:TRAP-type mannitol/chloroaromatic compound transport system permease large subunit